MQKMWIFNSLWLFLCMIKYYYDNSYYLKQEIRERTERILVRYSSTNNIYSLKHLFKNNFTFKSICNSIRYCFVLPVSFSNYKLSKCRTINDVVNYIYDNIISTENLITIKYMEKRGYLKQNSNGIR